LGLTQELREEKELLGKKQSTGGGDKQSLDYSSTDGVAALVWNGAIRAIFAKVFGDPDTIAAMLIYAIVVTIIAVVVTIVIARSLAREG